MLLFIYRSIELLRKARDELAHHHSQLVQVSHKYERSVFKNSKLEDSVSSTKRELEEFKRKDAENAKAIKQVIPFCPRSSHVVASHGVRANLWHVNISGCSVSCKKRCLFPPSSSTRL